MIAHWRPHHNGMFAETVAWQGHNADTVYGYLARPLGEGPYPCVVVLHEVFGLVDHIKEVARKLAAHGFIALAPDLHFREGPGRAEDVAVKVREAGGVPDDRCIGDVEGAVRYLRSLPLSNGKVGAMGYCSGGRQTYLAACNLPDLDAAVDCYGGRVVAMPDQLTPRQPIAPIDMTERLSCPLLGLFGAEDHNPSSQDVARMEEELQRHRKVFEFHTYADSGHGFFADFRPSYRVEAANDGWSRVFAWFGKYLSS